MCKLVKAEKWIPETFEKGSEPTYSEVTDWVKSAQVPGRIIGDEVFIEADRFAYGHTSPAANQSQQQLTPSTLLG